MAERELAERGSSFRIRALAVMHDGHWAASVALYDDRGRLLGGREVTGAYASCRELDVPVALVVATLLDALREPSEPASGAAARAPEAHAGKVGVGAFLAGALGLVPGVAAGAGAALDLPLAWPLAIDASAYLPGTELDAAGRGARAMSFHAGAALCPRLFGRRHVLRLCGGVQAGGVVATGVALTDSRRAARPLVLAGVEPQTDAGVEPLAPNPDYAVGQYDVAFAYKRASVLYCGHSPAYEDMAPFRDTAKTPEARKALMHERIEQCLQGEYWQKEGLVRIADDRIRPIRNLGQDSEVFLTIPLPTLLTDEVRLRSVMGDYRYDYRLWVYALSGNRDARDLLLAQYYVEENPDGSWRLTEDTIPKADAQATAGGQMLEKPYRAGMITTMWFLTRNTMFSDLPRTTAAAAYRAYLGADISKMQGLIPVAGEPDDVDDKGVDAPRCAACHSTLDPLAYAFAPYTGLEYDGLAATVSVLLFGQLEGGLFGIFDPERPAMRMPAWSPADQQPVLLGKPVQDLRQWAEVAAQSDEFARNLATIFYTHAFAREAEGAELAAFAALWQGVRSDGYSANRLIHRLIDSPTFGVP